MEQHVLIADSLTVQLFRTDTDYVVKRFVDGSGIWDTCWRGNVEDDAWEAFHEQLKKAGRTEWNKIP